MKTTVIQLEPHDDLISVRDKMSWAKTERILLAWPRRRKPNIRPLDMVLLKRHAVSLGAQLGVAIRDGELRRAAESVGIPVYRSAPQAQRADWPQAPQPKFRRRKRRKVRSLRLGLEALRKTEMPAWLEKKPVRIAIFSAGVLAVIVLLLLFVPSANIEIFPETETQTVTVPISASLETQNITLAGAVPLHEAFIEVEGSDSLPATGKLSVPANQASGAVRFTNPAQTAVTIPPGTVVSTLDSPSIEFSTTEAGTVASAGSIDLPVRAVNGGKSGNVPAGSVARVLGDLQFVLDVTNPDPTRGGTDVSRAAPDDADRARLLEQVSAALVAQAGAQAGQVLPDGAVFVPGSAALVETVDESFDPPAGIAGKTLALTLRQRYKLSYLSGEDLQALGGGVLNASLPEDFTPNGAVTVFPLGEPVRAADGSLRWEVQLQREIARHVGLAEVISLVRGRTPGGAKSALGALPLAGLPRITMRPAWWPVLPLIPARISLETGG